MIDGVAIPHRPDADLRLVRINPRDLRSFYPYVSRGPAEGGYHSLGGMDVVVYVNSRYVDFDEDTSNPRASALFEMAGVGMSLGEIRGDCLLVLGPDKGEYERSVP